VIAIKTGTEIEQELTRWNRTSSILSADRELYQISNSIVEDIAYKVMRYKSINILT